jgi:hypothetical protein
MASINFGVVFTNLAAGYVFKPFFFLGTSFFPTRDTARATFATLELSFANHSHRHL